ncbi:MAG: MazG nucleotide pyrophosphohydrolase domain-containing protein, partial [Myxococcota bacterium]
MSSLLQLKAVVARLRAECPWDRQQDLRTMRPYLLEEAHEVLDALDSFEEDPSKLREELGDLLFQIYFLARLAEEQGVFDLEAAAEAIVTKMIERHPHVYGGADAGAG